MVINKYGQSSAEFHISTICYEIKAEDINMYVVLYLSTLKNFPAFIVAGRDKGITAE